MRDPQGSVHVDGDQMRRLLHAPLPHDHLLHAPGGRRLVADGLLTAFEWAGDREITSPRLPFVSHPYEWCDAQLRDAALLTLDLSEQLLADKHELKDASAWNVIFDGTAPVFCDLLSIVPIESREWWAFGQFARHFVLPLGIARARRLRSAQVFQLWRDGIDLPNARRLLGWRGWASRCLPVLALPSNQRRSTPVPAASPTAPGPTLHRNLYATSRWMVGPPPPARRERHGWSRYIDERSHYAAPSLRRKLEQVDTWLHRLLPKRVLDLGCNTGEFSLIAIKRGAQTVSVDQDHDCIQSLYLSRPRTRGLYPMIVALDDVGGGRGWESCEFPGWIDRNEASFDVVLMLALIHHLAIGAAIALTRVAAFAARLTREWLIVEWLPDDDPQVVALSAQRRRDPAGFSIGHQREAFRLAGFYLQHEVELPGGHRKLALLRKSPSNA